MSMLRRTSGSLTKTVRQITQQVPYDSFKQYFAFTGPFFNISPSNPSKIMSSERPLWDLLRLLSKILDLPCLRYSGNFLMFQEGKWPQICGHLRAFAFLCRIIKTRPSGINPVIPCSHRFPGKGVDGSAAPHKLSKPCRNQKRNQISPVSRGSESIAPFRRL